MSESGDILRVEDIHKLLENFSKNAYKAKESDIFSEKVQKQCLALFAKDYKFSIINNTNGELCSHYPSQIVLLEYERDQGAKKEQSVECIYDLPKLRDLFTKARFARCRARFAVPVILYEGKHICRSATISGGAEIYGRSGFDFFFTGGESIPGEEAASDMGNTEWQLFDRIRGQDIRLLKELQVKTICDLMVEKKKVKFGMNVTSSEKVDKENRYSDFNILCTPYPGCEFFRDWKDNNYAAEGMKFDWNQGYVDSILDIPPDSVTSQVKVDWSTYKEWDLVRLTQTYIKLLLKYVAEGEGGLLVHCISGWDRTPLFISLLRLSLWADGAIHTSLSAMEILYLTLAYDWYLFGHNLPDRLNKGEDIFLFCFTFLKHLTSEEFSVKPKRIRSTSRTDSECNFDGVLLDSDNPTACSNYRGSNASINSTGSLGSSCDNIMVSAPEDEVTMTHANGNPSVSYSTIHRRSPINRIVGGVCDVPKLGVSGHSLAMSIPVAVPSAINKTQSNSGSSVCGRYHETTDMPDDNPRKKRLDVVWRLFRSIYAATGDFRNGSEGGGIGGLLDHFAEKVGFRTRPGMAPL
ncbi:myotubularin-related protein 14-like isoform X2 [Lineus longissimus]|uniref:myotubularin-related protein 14-like isoform X2 n=1 Tax=Lineus longissimus TaxID=88925 RepID=UPI002B4C69A3